jgi:3-deoxy-D-manno-octulosonate 8-phosphate phosphatase (KDO 8-P phosphatase)
MENIKLIVLDVDGTLTDGIIHYDSAGSEHKHFHAGDGLGIVMALAVGLKVAIVSGRRCAAGERRMEELKVGDVLQGIGDKGPALRMLMAKYNLIPEEVAYVGDDINDLPAFEVVGVCIAVADAAAPLRRIANYVTPRPGGHGAVRDAIEEILRRQGRYDEAVTLYLERSRRTEAAARQ